jgi:myo-inositol catabolism protein IolC
MTKRFEELVAEILALHKAKNSDYSKDSEALSNFYEVEDLGISAWKGVMVRLCDKWSRIKTLANKKDPSVKDEKIVDTLKDMAVYSLLCIELIERAEKQAKEDEARIKLEMHVE